MLEVDLDYRPPPIPAPFVITDTIAPRYCHGTGKTYDSKSRMYEDLKFAGVQPVGKDFRVPTPEDPITDAAIEDTIRKSLNDLRYGNAEITEEQKHLCKEQNERLNKYKRKPLRRKRTRSGNSAVSG